MPTRERQDTERRMEDSGEEEEEEEEISTVSSSPEGKVDAPLTIAGEGDEGDDDEEEGWANPLTTTFALGERFSSFSDAAGCCCSA